MIRLLFVFLTIFCASLKPSPVIVVEATSESWAGGVKGSGSGVNYRVKVIVNRSSEALKFDTLWVGQSGYGVQASRPHPFSASDGFKRKDTVIIYASRFQPSDLDGELMPVAETPKPPIQYEGAGLLSYWYKNKRYFKVIDSIKQLPGLYYP